MHLFLGCLCLCRCHLFIIFLNFTPGFIISPKLKENLERPNFTHDSNNPYPLPYTLVMSSGGHGTSNRTEIGVPVRRQPIPNRPSSSLIPSPNVFSSHRFPSRPSSPCNAYHHRLLPIRFLVCRCATFPNFVISLLVVDASDTLCGLLLPPC